MRRSSGLQGRAQAGDHIALRQAVRLLHEAGRTNEAIVWLQARAQAGDSDALHPAAYLLNKVGQTGEAIIYSQRAIEADFHGLREAACLLKEAGRIDEMERLRQYGIEPGGRIADRWTHERLE
jgi:hypothetical protein